MEGVPVLQRGARAVEDAGGAVGEDRGGFFLRVLGQRFEPGELVGDGLAGAFQRFRAGARIGVFERAARFGQGDQRADVRQQVFGLAVAAALEGEVAQIAGEAAAQQLPVDAVFQSEAVVVDLAEAFLPAAVERIERGFAAFAEARVVGVVDAVEIAQVALHDGRHALRCGRHFGQRRHEARLRRVLRQCEWCGSRCEDDGERDGAEERAGHAGRGPDVVSGMPEGFGMWAIGARRSHASARRKPLSHGERG